MEKEVNIAEAAFFERLKSSFAIRNHASAFWKWPMKDFVLVLVLYLQAGRRLLFGRLWQGCGKVT